MDEAPDPDDLGDLYGRPLAEFVSARNHLAKRLTAEGRREAAELVRGLARPSVALWAVNQLASRAADDVERLLDTGAELRAAQTRVLGGDRAAADELRDLGAGQTAIVTRLRDRARILLVEAGHAASDAALRRVETTLRASATGSPEIQSALRRGHLTAEVEPAGFGEFTGLAVLPRPAPPRRRDPELESRRADAEAVRQTAERELSDAETVARRLRREADRAEAALDRRRQELAEAEAIAREAAGAADAAEARVEAARRALDAARSARDELRPPG